MVYCDSPSTSDLGWLSNGEEKTAKIIQKKVNFEKSIEKDSLKIVKKITRYSSISFPGDVAIFKNQVVILNWQENPSAILITNANLAQEYKDFFLGLWKLAKH